MASTRPGQRKTQILQALAAMLEQPKSEKITTAALAARLALSEAALYRHFASKAQMYEGLIDFIEAHVFGELARIAAQERQGLTQARAALPMLLQFAVDHPGMTRVLTGDALVGEDERLQLRMLQFDERLETFFRQALATAAAQGNGSDADVGARAELLVCYLAGAWQRYARGGFKQAPTDHVAVQAALLLAVRP